MKGNHMRRNLIALLVLVLLITWGGFAVAGGRHRGYGHGGHYGHYRGHHNHNSALWWGVGIGAGLGILGGVLAARPYYSGVPIYPTYGPGVVPHPYGATWLYCPAAGAYYPYVPSCPMPWVPVPVGY